MSFGEKLREIRTQENLTQQEMADRIGVSLRTLKSYELGETLPRYRKIYHKIAEEFNVDVNYLLTEGDDFILSAGEKYGSRGMKGAQELIDNARALFAGGELSEDDKKVVFDALQEAFFEAKLENKKYTPKRYKKDEK
ncbi:MULTISPECIES: helix-turn-helix domain-containing protein [Tissierellales]|uniref:Transcriptional regulator, contains XRE-family HTH domain n=1 Tax=Sporanaerobacter acetigenes DSM 13106 TaxID=1123281 RepID=A0A1M5YGZ9_9FIRM|nr:MULTISPECIES: helix-turn-helix transcriptional regulator [Tissierellales]SHI11266.1 Transcriptional regulator, contains XRE-family HTH domain [Sporanaerobacter acetigenes DSM 13106]